MLLAEYTLYIEAKTAALRSWLYKRNSHSYALCHDDVAELFGLEPDPACVDNMRVVIQSVKRGTKFKIKLCGSRFAGIVELVNNKTGEVIHPATYSWVVDKLADLKEDFPGKTFYVTLEIIKKLKK